MAIFSPLVRERLEQKGLSCLKDSRFLYKFAFNGPVAFSSKSSFVRSKIDSFSCFSYNSICKTSSIGRYCSIGDNVYIGPGTHDMAQVSTSASFSKSQIFNFAGYHLEREAAVIKARHGIDSSIVTVGHDVWIGSYTIIPKDVTIGHGAVIGARSIITKDVPPYAVVVGNNRIVKYRFSDEVIADLIELNWWNYNIPKMIQKGIIGDEQLNDPKTFIAFFKNADPVSLIPLEVNWYLVDVEGLNTNKVKIYPVTEPIKLF